MLKTMTLHLDATAERTLQITLPPDLPPGPLEVVLVIGPATLAATASDQPTNLAGRWASYFPADFDLDGALKEIRSEWEKEWDEDELLDNNSRSILSGSNHRSP